MKLFWLFYLLFPSPFQDAWKKEGGVELDFRLLHDKIPPDLARSCAEALGRRLNEAGFPDAQVDAIDRERIRVRIAGVTTDRLKDLRTLFSVTGSLELRAVASKEIHEAWDPTTLPPKGYSAVENNDRGAGEYAYLSGQDILVSKEPVATGKDFAKVAISNHPDAGGWRVDFELTEDGARRFDEVASTLFRQAPPGLLAILLDGKIISRPAIRSEKFGGKGCITGNFDEAEAKNLATTLRSGALPCPIGSYDEKRNPRPGVPEAERFVPPIRK